MSRRSVATLLAVAVLLLGVVGWYVLSRRGQLPAPGSDQYEAVTRSFYRGLAAMEVGLLDDAAREFARTGELASDEPAAWANLGLVRLRLGDLDAAAEPLGRAAALAPDRGEIWFLLGRMETARGRIDEGIAHLRRAVELDPDALQPRFALAEEIERAAAREADAEAQRVVDDLLVLQPENLAVLVERTRLAGKRGDVPRLQDSIRRLQPRSSMWPAVAAAQLTALQQATAASNTQEATRAALLLRNVLLRVPAFLEDLAAVKIPAELFAHPLDRFVRLPPPRSQPAPPDDAITFVREELGNANAAPATALLAFSLDGGDITAIIGADAREARRLDDAGGPFAIPGGTLAPAAPAVMLALDWNHDFRNDLVLAGRDGVRLLLQGDGGQFADATPSPAPNADAPRDIYGAWSADVEMDGDLDIVVAPTGGPAVVLRNNGDGTWRPEQPFGGTVNVRGFVWGDIDRDGDPDAALLEEGGAISLFVNRQAGVFERLPGPDGIGSVVAVTVGDLNADGVLDLVTLGADGSLRRSSRTMDSWEQEAVGAWSTFPGGGATGSYRLFLSDFDNNGALDVLGSGPAGSALWLAEANLALRPVAAPDAHVFSVRRLDDDGRLDLLGLSNGRAVRLLGRGTKDYHWQVIRPRAQQSAGDQRINSFGVGGDVEVRAGLLLQKQTLAGGPVHIGLGDRTSIDVARIVWPNGVPQAEFDVAADGAIVAEQRLKGSCPWVFAYDGTGMRFITDFLWRSPLGLRINAQDTAGVTQTEDWIRIRGDQLIPRDGVYDVRITAELWESHYIDHVSLMVVDHPIGTEVYVDERFAPQPPALAVHATAQARPLARVWDHKGTDVSALLAQRDDRYLAAFERGRYQGVARDHFVEFEISDSVPPNAPLWLLAYGWVYPTDSSINVAIGQGADVQPRGLSLDAQAPDGRWSVVAPDLGFPAGKNKTILVDLAGAARRSPGARRFRLRTNLEIYWDHLSIAATAPTASLRTINLEPSAAELRYRGFSVTEHVRADVPETPIYARLANVTPRWRDLIGYYTRFGEVEELVTRVDDRYVIMNAGDELLLEFPAQAPPPPGWSRDYVLVGDGWNKDGDFNTSQSSTVTPLPSHGRVSYDAKAAIDLETDPVFQRHATDWQTYHTRYVTPQPFLDGLWGPNTRHARREARK